MKNYYKKELEQLKDSEYAKTVKLFDNQGNSTKHLSLNAESIPVLIKWLEKELTKVKE
jgi:hypothetical protein